MTRALTVIVLTECRIALRHACAHSPLLNVSDYPSRKNADHGVSDALCHERGDRP